MVNLGNSCYMNSIVQILFSLPDFKERYLSEAVSHLDTCQKWTADCFHCMVSKLIHGLWSGLYSEKREAKKIAYEGQTEEEKSRIDYCQDGIKPQMFKSLIGKDHPEFSSAKQQDALEYFQHLLEKFQRAEKAAKGPNPGDIFEFELETRLQCTVC